MKKTLPLLAGGALLFAAVIYLLQVKKSTSTPDPAALVAADAPLFFCIPDIRASRERWATTALAKMIADPEIRAFLKKPIASLRGNESLDQNLAILESLNPGQAFLAVTALEGNDAKFLAGIRHQATKEQVDAALAPVNQRIQDKYPAGKAELEMYEGVTLETYTASEYQIARATDGDWLLLANDAVLLKQTLDRLHKRAAPPSLDTSETYKMLRAKLPASVETVLIIQTQTLVERLVTMLGIGGSASAEQLAALEKLKGVAASTSIEGSDLRDTIYFLGLTQKEQTTLKMPVLSLSSPETLLLFASKFRIKPDFQLPDPALDASGYLGLLSGFLKQLDTQGLGMEKLAAAFGPEAGLILDWAAQSPQPGLIATLGVTDRAIASQLLDNLARQYGAVANISHVEENGTEFYTMSLGGFIPINPTVALASDRMYISSDGKQLRSRLAADRKDSLEQSESFRKSSDNVVAPTESFVYVDTKMLMERLYGTLRPMLVFGAGMMPTVSAAIDTSALPTTEALTRHLTPMVFSQSADPDGTLLSSTGPITLNQLVILSGASAVIVQSVKSRMGN